MPPRRTAKKRLDPGEYPAVEDLGIACVGLAEGFDAVFLEPAVWGDPEAGRMR